MRRTKKIISMDRQGDEVIFTVQVADFDETTRKYDQRSKQYFKSRPMLIKEVDIGKIDHMGSERYHLIFQPQSRFPISKELVDKIKEWQRERPLVRRKVSNAIMELEIE